MVQLSITFPTKKCYFSQATYANLGSRNRLYLLIYYHAIVDWAGWLGSFGFEKIYNKFSLDGLTNISPKIPVLYQAIRRNSVASVWNTRETGDI